MRYNFANALQLTHVLAKETKERRKMKKKTKKTQRITKEVDAKKDNKMVESIHRCLKKTCKYLRMQLLEYVKKPSVHTHL